MTLWEEGFLPEGENNGSEDNANFAFITMRNIRDQFNSAKHISSAHPGQAPGAVLGTGDPAVNKKDLVPASSRSQLRRQGDNKEVISIVRVPMMSSSIP